MNDSSDQQQNMVNIEIDGRAMQAPRGSMIIEATDKAGIDIPRFCYHKKLSIAANCRMCLVDVEKAPKPLPACATPVMEGMKVYTESRRAIDAQHGVMEFLLINHPLDCPICDQGGECELQDLAMGYGRSVSRFTERKRVVKDKNVGPLVQTEMTRCIHCTRCVRFLEEIAGTTEMGGSGRGDRLEIGTCVENSIDSELSGNIIDLCPVGALTNKPFRFAARAWELVAKPSVANHDGLGSVVYHHQRRGRILRTVPRENEFTNETWLSDRDRFSHLGLYSDDRATQPMVKVDGEWRNVDWDQAIAAAAAVLNPDGATGPADDLGILMSGNAATEEYFLAQRLARSIGCNNIDHRLRECDFTDDGTQAASPAFEMKISEIDQSDVILLLGCNPRHEVPLLGHRLRKTWLAGASLAAINPLDWEFIFDLDHKTIVAPQFLVPAAAALAAAVAESTGSPVPPALDSLLSDVKPSDSDIELAQRLGKAERGLVLLGQFAMSHPEAASLRQLAGYIATATGTALNRLPHGGNPVGAWLAGAVPHRGPGGSDSAVGKNAAEMLTSPCSKWLLWDFEPEFDLDNPSAGYNALQDASDVVVVTSFTSSALLDIATVILPLTPMAESEGTIHNFDGQVVPFSTAGKVTGGSKQGWKILRRLGAEMGLPEFAQNHLSEVQAEMNSEIEQGLIAGTQTVSISGLEKQQSNGALWRIGEVPMYSVDALCRRSGALQQTVHAESGFAGLNPADAVRLGLVDGDTASVGQGDSKADFEVMVTGQVPEGAVWIRAANQTASGLGPAIGPVKVEQSDA
jgi:NADH-quinone oxidoreductase subunit G